MAQWIEGQTAKQRIAGSIPSPGHMPRFQARFPVGGEQKQPHIGVSLPLWLPPSAPPFPSL